MADALEGFERVPSFEALPAAAEVFPISPTPLVPAAKGWFSFSLNGWIVGAIAGATILGSVIVWNNEKAPQKIASKHMETPGVSNHPSTDKQVSGPTEALTDTESTAASPGKQSGQPQEQAPVIPVSEVSRPDESPSEDHQSESYSSSRLIAASVSQVNGYKVLDYSDVYGHGFPKLTEVISQGSTRVSSASGYLGFLRECLDYCDKGHHEYASRGFQWLLNVHPEDVNALYFEAMCRFHLGEFSRADQGFRRVIANPVAIHKQSAMFFLAKSLIALNREEEAIPILQAISTGNGKLSQEATTELQRITGK